MQGPPLKTVQARTWTVDTESAVVHIRNNSPQNKNPTREQGIDNFSPNPSCRTRFTISYIGVSSSNIISLLIFYSQISLVRILPLTQETLLHSHRVQEVMQLFYIFYSHTFTLFSSINIRNNSSQPYSRTGYIVMLYVLFSNRIYHLFFA